MLRVAGCPREGRAPGVNHEHMKPGAAGAERPAVNVIGGSTSVSETLKAAQRERGQQPGGRIISRRDKPLSRFRSQSL